jgi:hypothetical protein
MMHFGVLQFEIRHSVYNSTSQTNGELECAFVSENKIAMQFDALHILLSYNWSLSTCLIVCQ